MCQSSQTRELRPEPGRSPRNGREAEHARVPGCVVNVPTPQGFTNGVQLVRVVEREIWRPTLVCFDQLNIDLCCVWALAD